MTSTYTILPLPAKERDRWCAFLEKKQTCVRRTTGLRAPSVIMEDGFFLNGISTQNIETRPPFLSLTGGRTSDDAFVGSKQGTAFTERRDAAACSFLMVGTGLLESVTGTRSMRRCICTMDARTERRERCDTARTDDFTIGIFHFFSGSGTLGVPFWKPRISSPYSLDSSIS